MAMRVLVVSPHPDDAEVFAGGTARLHVLRGDRVVEAILTRGERGALFLKGEALARRRVEEARRAGARIGYAEIHQFDLGDGRLSDREAAARLGALADGHPPDRVYAPEPVHSYYRHPDHMAAGRAALRVFEGRTPLRLYHTRLPDHREEIASVWNTKREALREHRSQRPLLELGRILTYLNPAWSALRKKVELFRTVPAQPLGTL